MSRRFVFRQFVFSFSLSAILAIASGCASTDDDGFSFSPSVGDVDPAFAVAKKTLEKPERAFLSYAGWKADIGQLAEARGAYENILSSNANSVDALLGLANVEIKAGRIKEAESKYKRAVGVNPSNAKAVYALGKFYATQNKMADAVGMLSKAVTEEPTNPTYRFDLGVALAKSGQLNEGLSHLALTVGEAEANYNIGYLLNEQGKSREAIPYLRQAISLKPGLKQAHELIAGITTGGQRQNVAETRTFAGQVPATTVSMPNYRPPAVTVAPGQQYQQHAPPQQQQYIPPQQQHASQQQQQQFSQPAPVHQGPAVIAPANNGYRAPQPAPTAAPLLPQVQQQIQPQQQQWQQRAPVMPLPQAQIAPQRQLPNIQVPNRQQINQQIRQTGATQAAPNLTSGQIQQLIQATK